MYPCIETFVAEINAIKEDTFEKYDCVEYYGIEENAAESVACGDREKCLKMLLTIFEEYNWSEEFVTAFGVYCNFYILTGMHLVLPSDKKFGLEKLYDIIDDSEDIEYLECIRQGIFEQDYDSFVKAVDMNLYRFGLPWLYIYILNYGALILYEEEELENIEERKTFLALYAQIKESEKQLSKLSKELHELITPIKIESDEEYNEFYRNLRTEYLPYICVSDAVYQKTYLMKSDLNILADVSGVGQINNFIDFWNSMVKSLQSNSEKKKEYLFFSQSFFSRLLESGMNSREYDYAVSRCDRDESMLDRSFYLKLPFLVSPQGNLMLRFAQEVELRTEKEILIERNRKMVEDYSHSVENVIKPFLISKVAEELRKDKKNIALYRSLIQVYNSEVTTRNECRLLRMVHDFKTTAGAVRAEIRKCREFDERAERATFQELLCQALSQIVRSVIDEKKHGRMKFIRAKMEGAGIDLDKLDCDYWEFEGDKTELPKGWEEALNIKIAVANELAEAEFAADEVGTTFLYTRMVELLTNAFTYGAFGKGKEIIFRIYLTGEEQQTKYIVFDVKNAIGDRSYRSGKNGLDSMNIMLERINGYDSERDVFLEQEEWNGSFNIRVYFDADLYL